MATEFLGACKLEARASRCRPCRLQQCEACVAQSPYTLRSSLAPAPLWNPLCPAFCHRGFCGNWLSKSWLSAVSCSVFSRCIFLEWGSLSWISEASTQFSKGMRICHGVSWQGGETDCPTGNKGGRALRHSSPVDVVINSWSLPVLAVSCT